MTFGNNSSDSWKHPQLISVITSLWHHTSSVCQWHELISDAFYSPEFSRRQKGLKCSIIYMHEKKQLFRTFCASKIFQEQRLMLQFRGDPVMTQTSILQLLLLYQDGNDSIQIVTNLPKTKIATVQDPSGTEDMKVSGF